LHVDLPRWGASDTTLDALIMGLDFRMPNANPDFQGRSFTTGGADETAADGTCKLCRNPCLLQLSHVVPAFVFKWLKDTSATGFIRLGDKPNLRAQDGYKRYWLCRGCEETLNTFETPFATKVFHPLSADGSQRIAYEEWFLKFCISISWRVIQIMRENDGFSNYTQAQLARVDVASMEWAHCLLAKAPHPGRFEQHFLLLDAIEESTYDALPANLNRYLLRTVNLDVVRGANTIFTFAKLSKFLILGFIELRNPKEWLGTKVHVRHGYIGTGNYVVPHQFGDYLSAQAQKFAAIHGDISESQRAKIDSSMRANIERVARSASFQAMSHDVGLFGSEAFEIHRPRAFDPRKGTGDH
jgi:hypothetical protein